MAFALADCSREINASPTRLNHRYSFRRTGCDDLTAFISGARAYIDDPVARCNHIHVVLDDDDRVAGLHKAVELCSFSRSTSDGCKPVVGSSRT